MARLSKRYGPKGAFAPERLPPPPPEPEPEPEPQPELMPSYAYPLPLARTANTAVAGDGLVGVDAATLRAAIANNLWLHAAGAGAGAGHANTERLVVPVRGAGSRLWDTEGREYLDGRTDETGANLGHGRQEVAAAMAAQGERLPAASPDTPSVPAALLAGRLAALSPTGAGSRVLFTPAGSEAVEVALKVARAYQRAAGFPGRYKVIGRHYADHGGTAGALAVSGLAHLKTPFEPLVPGTIHVTPPYRYRCPYCADAEGCTYACADEAGRAIALAGPELVAAVVVEPVQSGGGCIVPPPGYHERVRAACDAHGVLLIADETTCGMGRVGTLFASEAFELRPDIVAVSGGLTGGYAALGAVIVAKDVANAVLGNEREMFVHSVQTGAFAGLPVAAAAALATLDLLEREELPGRSRDMGAYLLRELETALRDHPEVGEIRGMGLFVAVELVRDRDTRALLDDLALLRSLADETQRRGLLCRVDARPFPVIRLAPPFTIEREDVDRVVAIIAASLDAVRGTIGTDTSGRTVPDSGRLQLQPADAPNPAG